MAKPQVTLTFAGDTKKLESAFDRVGAGAKGMGGQVEQSGGRMKKFGKLAAGAGLAVGTAAVAIGVSSFSLSQELSKLDTKSKAVFEDQLGSMQKWAEENKRAFGTSRDQVVGLAANMTDLLKPMGFTAKEATGMTQDMLGLSGALAEWSGGTHDAAAVSEILTKALLGERDQLKSLGISISEADVTARLAKKGQKDLTGAALQQAKALATQELIMEKSTDAQKAWAEGGKAAAEAENASKVAMQEAKEALARGLTPAFEVGTKVVAGFAEWAGKNQGTVKNLAIAIGILAAGVLVVSAAVKVAAAVQAVWNAVMFLNPIGLIILAIVALVAIIVVIAKKTDWFQKLWHFIWSKIGDPVKAIWKWIKGTLWPGIKMVWSGIVKGAQMLWQGIRMYFGFWRGLLSNVIGWVSNVWTSARNTFNRIVSAVRNIPGRIRSSLSNVVGMISAPFRNAFQGIRNAWNSTIGGRGFTVPSWVPGFGGNAFHIPTLHKGGIVPGAPGTETMAVLQAGERVWSANQAKSLGTAAKQMLSAIRSGGRFFEDFSFRGMSGITSKWNDQIADAFYRLGLDFNRRTATDFLEKIVDQTRPRPQTLPPVDHITIEIRSGGSKMDDLLVQILARSIRVRGGNVQAVLGNG